MEINLLEQLVDKLITPEKLKEKIKNNYPYLFSLAMQLNPFDEKATPEIK